MKLVLKFITVILLFIHANFSLAQVNVKDVHVIPELSVGYIMGVSFVWGIDVNITSFGFSISDNIRSTSGIGFTYNHFSYQRSNFNSFGFNLVNFTNYSQVKIGGNWIRTKWGENKINKSHSNQLGINFEVGATFSEYLPWLTFRAFGESNQCLWLPLRKQYQFNLKYLYDIPFQVGS